MCQQLLQAEKEEAWKAEQLNKSSVIQLAQKDLEDVRFIYVFLVVLDFQKEDNSAICE